jgi:hypothetical protein
MAAKQKKTIDFLIIGAAKSGTTSLYEWVKEHPQIYMPKGKELPFFTEPHYKKGLKWYLNGHFLGAPTNKLWGKATPQYMHGIHDVMPEEVAKRIHHDLPNVKLVAVLRDPVERAYSHYKMIVRRGHESRTFDEAVKEETRTSVVAQARAYQDETNSYVVTGEYGRILQYYFALFDISQIKVYFADDLATSRKWLTKDLFTFLGVDNTFRPKNLFTDYHKGGSKPRVRLLTPQVLNKLPAVPLLWALAPNSVRRRVNFGINRWNIKTDGELVDKSSSVYTELKKYYAKDTKLLENLLGVKVPWA